MDIVAAVNSATLVENLCGESSEEKNRWVITPGGPRPSDKVHPVKPGEAVHRNPDL